MNFSFTPNTATFNFEIEAVKISIKKFTTEQLTAAFEAADQKEVCAYMRKQMSGEDATNFRVAIEKKLNLKTDEELGDFYNRLDKMRKNVSEILDC